MKKSKLFVLALLPILSSCVQTPSYTGVKYVLDYVSDGALVEITPHEMFTISSIEQKDSVFLIGGLASCSGCIEAEEQCSYYAQMNHCNIYFIDIDNVSFLDDYNNVESDFVYPDTDYYWLYLSSTYVDDGEGYYALPSPNNAKQGELSLPYLYFFKYGGVGYRTNSNFATALKNRIEVKEA